MALYLQGLGEGASFNSIEEWEALSGEEFRRGRRGRSQTEPDSAGGRPSRQETPRRAGEDPRREAEEDLPTFSEWREEIQALVRKILEENDLDGLFFPQAGAPIPDLIEDPERPDYNPNNHPELPSNIVNDIGLPVVTVPFAYYEDHTPFVLAFIGDLWTEKDLLAYAYDLERATRSRVAPRLVRVPEG
jgi:Asp-tRNA(Asn)/Glu-tRNA(Gln) amidotransferase A subunit family amidase